MFWCRSLSFAMVVVGCAAPLAPAAIDLELRAVPEPCSSSVLEVDLYAVSDSAEPQGLRAMDVILSWDAATLELLGVNEEFVYPYDWQRSTFPQPDPFDLNDTWADGDALYQAWSRLAPEPPAYATPEGLLVARLTFAKHILGDPSDVDIEPSLAGGVTVVYDAFSPGTPVTGMLAGVTVWPLATGDADCSRTIAFEDIKYFAAGLSGEASWAAYHVLRTGQLPTCSYLNLDANCDGRIDFNDIKPFAALLGG